MWRDLSYDIFHKNTLSVRDYLGNLFPAQVNEQQEHSEQQMVVDLEADDVLRDQLAEASIDPPAADAHDEVTAACASQVAVAKARLCKVRNVGKAVKSKKP